MYYFHPTRGFLVEGLHADIPSDAVPVNNYLHAELMAEQASGKVIVLGANGPEAVRPSAQFLPTSWYVPVPLLRQRLEAAGKWVAAATVIVSKPPVMLKLLTLQQGVANDDADAIALLQGIGADPVAMLARPGA